MHGHMNIKLGNFEYGAGAITTTSCFYVSYIVGKDPSTEGDWLHCSFTLQDTHCSSKSIPSAPVRSYIGVNNAGRCFERVPNEFLV